MATKKKEESQPQQIILDELSDLELGAFMVSQTNLLHQVLANLKDAQTVYDKRVALAAEEAIS